MKYSILVYFCVLTFWTVDLAQSKDATCDKCVSKDECKMFQSMNPAQQYVWMNKYPCTNILYKGYRVPVKNGVYVCCSDRLWATEMASLINGYGGSDDTLNLEYFDIYADEDDDILEIPDNYQNFYTTGPSVRPGHSNLNSIPRYPNGNVNPGGIHRIAVTTARPDLKHDALRDGINGEQCLASSFPPKPASGCCGLEASDSDRINGGRVRRDADKPGNVTIGTRITGGQETSLYQFPWTVQLESTFKDGVTEKIFACGGSLISARYVLTAAHCVYRDTSSPLIKVNAYLAEYDRSTFPIDCANVMNYGKQCVDNVLIPGEQVIRHSQYEDKMLYNDIALVRLRENAPYNELIRPICLTSINIDDPKLANMPLAAAGWGLNGRRTTNIKQSTVVNLVPHEQCRKDYPTISNGQICAAGYSGQDTCQGDSGGPLMMLDGGKYYVVGIVSGKRSDTTCGSSIPTTYTSVYQYLDWILENIKN